MNGSIEDNQNRMPLRAGYMLIALGVVYGDIGTSPLYVMKSIVGGNGGINGVSNDFIIGALSLIIWTITLITTLKYVVVAMKADNHGEGGIFSLYHLVRKRAKWLVFLAMIGGAALLADGVLTPAVTVTSAIEGLYGLPVVAQVMGNGQIVVVFISVVIISVLFGLQRAGTSMIGRAFGPIMVSWFAFLAIVGIYYLRLNPSVLMAFNPIYGLKLLFSPYNKAGFMILGSIFLATTGAEALYSDMGHVGKLNIYASWPYVKVCLILNYLGQGAWIMHAHSAGAQYATESFNPFYAMLSEPVRIFAVIISTLAAIIASQALISGSYTLVSEAIHLRLLPHLQIHYPSETKGQMYIPMVNNLLWACCVGVILYFRSSSRMESAYGLAITVTMLMTTLLLFQYLRSKNVHHVFTTVFLIFFIVLECTFFVSSASKFIHGGYVAVIIAFAIFVVMFVWHYGIKIEQRQSKLYPAKQFVGQLRRLKEDKVIPFTATNLVFMSINGDMQHLERDVLYSILDKRPKRAQVYWFIHVNVTDKPYTMEYAVQSFGTDFCFKVKLTLGFKIEQRINVFMRQIIHDLMKTGEIKPQHKNYSIYEDSTVGDFAFVFIKKSLAPDSEVTGFERNVMRLRYAINHFTGSPVRWFGLENATTIMESVPLFVKVGETHSLKRIL